MIKRLSQFTRTLRFDPVSVSPLIWVVAGAALRFAGFASSSIWYDEAFSLNLTRFDPITLTKLAMSDFNPPLWELIAWLFVRPDFNEFGIRFPALLAGILCLWLVYKLTQLLEFTPGQTHAALALSALLPGMLWTAQDGRVYALLSALFLGGVYYSLKQRWLGLLACAGLMCYAHNSGPFLVLPLMVLYGYRGAGWRKANVLLLATAVTALPWLPGYLNASQVPHWLGPLTLDGWLVGMGQAWAITLPSLGAWLVAGEFITITLIFAITLALPPTSDRNDRSLLMIAAAPLALMLGYSLTKQNMIFYRPLIPLVMPLSLLIAKTLTPRRLTLTSWLIPYGFIVLLSLGLLTWSPELKGAQLSQQADLIRLNWQPGDVIYHATGTTALPFRQYLPEVPHYLLDEPQPAALLQAHLASAFGIIQADLDQLKPTRAWIIAPLDPVMTRRAQERINDYLSGAHLVGQVIYLQAAPIQIYLKEIP